MLIGSHNIDPPLILAPMAGVTDKPFRQLCKRLGAGYAVSEMTSSDPRLWRTRKSAHRLDHDGEPAPIGVQIAGADPTALAAAARWCDTPPPILASGSCVRTPSPKQMRRRTSYGNAASCTSVPSSILTMDRSGAGSGTRHILEPHDRSGSLRPA